MSTIFGHGRLRLYLLKLLDENPRHGYEIISLLRDRFLGVYSPSPGTIYPRLARLEEEGLVTHTEAGGRKVYRLTDKGRAELRDRSGDLDDLEREITDSVRDVARAVKQDVRATISSLREELKFAAGGARRPEPEAKGTKAGEAEPERGREGSDEKASPASGDSQDTREASGEAGEASGEQREHGKERSGGPGCEDGSRWTREWERFAQGFGAFGAVWGRGGSERSSEGPEFERALHDFSDRVRDVVREAGHVGEAAASDLRRILDDTVEVIRRDVRRWGPPSDRAEEPSEKSGGEPAAESAASDRDPGNEDGTEPADAGTTEAGTTEEKRGDRPREAPAGDGTAEEPKARPMPPSEESGGDPWGEAVRDDNDTGTGDSR